MSTKKKISTQENSLKIYSQILPITNLITTLGWYFTITSIVYVVTNQCCQTNKDITFTIEGVILFISLLATFFVKGKRQVKEISKEEASNDSETCLKCIEQKIVFQNHGLLDLNKLLAFEGELASSKDPRNCKVLVYTSDLAGEKDAEIEVKENIDKGVRYVVLYFANNCTTKETEIMENRYGKENLVDLSNSEEYKESFDGKLAATLGFDIMLYKKCDEPVVGYFAVDFVTDKIERDHDVECKECNYGKMLAYGKDKAIPFYKEISPDIAVQLFNNGLKLQKEMLENKNEE